jgi:N-acetyl-alpha-D-glucosaminyl L-malate synthase BshA
LGKKLAKEGDQVHFISYDIPFRLIGPWRKNIYFHRVDVADYPLFQNNPVNALFLANKIVEVAKQERLNILHAHYSVPFSMAIHIAQSVIGKDKIKTITTLHGTDVTLFGEDEKIAYVNKYAVKKSDAVTAVCKFLAEEAKKVFDLKKVDVIYNFVDVRKEPIKKSKELREIFAKENEKIIIHISNFREVKRIQDVLEIFKKIVKKIPSKLLLVGDGPEQPLAQRLASKFQIIDRVHFMGVQNNVARLLSIADILLLPSEKEAFNLTALESMTCGVPVISTKIGGMPEMIENGKEGYLLEVGDVKNMAEKSILLLSDEKLYKEISRNGRTKVREDFSESKIIPQYRALYKKIIKSA